MESQQQYDRELIEVNRLLLKPVLYEYGAVYSNHGTSLPMVCYVMVLRFIHKAHVALINDYMFN